MGKYGKDAVQKAGMSVKREETNTKELLINAGREVFLEKGFAGASLRKICERAGVTTGALYFFFGNKEDLFCQIVEPVLAQMEKLGVELSEEEFKDPGQGPDMDKRFVEFLWKNQKEIRLLLEKAAGTRYENFKDEIFSQMEHSFSLFFQKYGGMGDDQNLIHVLVEMRIKGYMELINGGYSMEEMLRLTEMVGCYADGGFRSLMKAYGREPRSDQNREGM